MEYKEWIQKANKQWPKWTHHINNIESKENHVDNKYTAEAIVNVTVSTPNGNRDAVGYGKVTHSDEYFAQSTAIGLARQDAVMQALEEFAWGGEISELGEVTKTDPYTELLTSSARLLGSDDIEKTVQIWSDDSGVLKTAACREDYDKTMIRHIGKLLHEGELYV